MDKIILTNTPFGYHRTVLNENPRGQSKKTVK